MYKNQSSPSLKDCCTGSAVEYKQPTKLERIEQDIGYTVDRLAHLQEAKELLIAHPEYEEIYQKLSV